MYVSVICQDTDGNANWTLEMQMHRKKYNKALEVEELIQGYDNDMIDKHKALKDLKKMYEEEKDETLVLREYFEEVNYIISTTSTYRYCHQNPQNSPKPSASSASAAQPLLPACRWTRRSPGKRRKSRP